MRRRDRLNQLVEEVKAGEEQIQFGLVVAEDSGTYLTIVNGRATPRAAVAGNDFAFNGTGHGVGDEVIMIASDLHDMPVIAGLSPWLVNQLGTEYSE